MPPDEQGGDEAGSPVPTPPPPPAPPAPPTDPAQEEMQRIAAAERERGSRAARKALLEELGFEKVDDLKALVTSAKEADQAKLSEVERLKAKAAEDAAAARADRKAAAAERHASLVERAMLRAGAQGDTAMLARLIDVQVGAEHDEIEAGVQAVKDKFPALFQAQLGTRSSEPAGGGVPSRQGSGNDPLAAGKARADAYNERNSLLRGFASPA